MGSWRCWKIVYLGALLVARPGLAQEVDDGTRAAARKLGNAGVEAFQAGKFADASVKLERAYRIIQAPSLGLWSARALARLGKLVEAQERYVAVGRLPTSAGDSAVQKNAQADAATELSALAPRIPGVTLQIVGDSSNGVSASIDGVALPAALIGEVRPVDPGNHLIVVQQADRRVEKSVSVVEGEQKTVEIQLGTQASRASAVDQPKALPVLPARAGAAQRTAGWVAIGVGGAGLAFGGVTGALALSKHGKLTDNAHCAGTQCGTALQSDVDSYNSLRTLSSLSFVAGGALSALGIVLLATAPRADSAPSVALSAWLGGASLHGAF